MSSSILKIFWTAAYHTIKKPPQRRRALRKSSRLGVGNQIAAQTVLDFSMVSQPQCVSFIFNASLAIASPTVTQSLKHTLNSHTLCQY